MPTPDGQPPVFPPRPDCTTCPLHQQGATHVGIPCRPCDYTSTPPLKNQALLIVGEAPGRQEDAKGMNFVGPSGGYLHRIYIGALSLQQDADVYLTNAVRCRPPNNDTPTKSQLKACRPHLIDDVRRLQAAYEKVTILCAGATASQTILGCSSTEAFHRQGDLQTWGWAGTEDLRPTPVFSTVHPANLLPGRNPSKLAPIRDHLRLLKSHLGGEAAVPVDAPPPIMAPPVPGYRPQRLSLDIESYGATQDHPPQRCFHPLKAQVLDKATALITSVALAWRDPAGAMQYACFRWADPAHQKLLAAHLANLAPGGELLGMNIKFDLMFLRYCSPVLRLRLNPAIRLLDVSVLNYLHSEQRPERSLKSLAPLLRIAKYDEATSLKRHRWASDKDPGLHSYNAKDSITTLMVAERLEQLILTDYPGTEKLSPYSRDWYSRLLWTCILMEEDGVAFSQEALDRLDFELVLKAALIWSECSARWGLTLSGKGSDAAKFKLFTAAAEAASLIGDSRLEVTEKKKELSVNRKNAALLLENLDPALPLAQQIRKQQEWEGLQKLITSYTRPMLYGTEKNPVGSRLILAARTSTLSRSSVMLATPSWFPVPSHFDSGADGGTMQGRITSKGPACQTMPYVVKKCLVSRFSPGFLLCVDLSQIELRVAALLSNDEFMCGEYRKPKPDLHTQAALLYTKVLLDIAMSKRPMQIELANKVYTADLLRQYLAEISPDHFDKVEAAARWPAFDLLRQMGKTTNFLTIYRGSAGKLRSTVADDLGVVLPLEVCGLIVDTFVGKCVGVRRYQDNLIETATRTGRIELPLTGQSRMFLGGKIAVDSTYVNEIVNFPIQTTAANIMLDIQYDLRRRLSGLNRRVCVGLNIYDSIFVDGPASVRSKVERLVAAAFARSDYYDRLCGVLDRTVPLGYDVSVVSSN